MSRRRSWLWAGLPLWLLTGVLCLGCEVEVDPREVAEAAFRAGDYPAAADAFAQALSTARAEERAHLLARHGQTLKLLGRNEAAEQALVAAIQTADARNEGEVGARARRYLGRLYGDLGRNEEAEARYAEAEGWYREQGPADELAKLQINRAALAWQAGSFDRAWNLYQDAYFRALTLEDARLQANGLDGMAMLLAYVGELADARGLVLQTALMHETAGRRADAAVAYATQGIIAVAEGNAGEGLRLADLAMAHADATGMQAARVQALIVRGGAFALANDAARALEAADQASGEAATLGMAPMRLEAELVALDALARLGRWSALAARADALRPETDEHRARLEVLRARHAAVRGDGAARRRHLEAAVASFDRLRAALGIEHLSSALTRTRRSAYDELITVLAEAGEAEAALRVVGSVKARALAERLRAEKDAPPPAPAPPAAGSDSPLPSARTVERAGNLFRLAAPRPPADPAALRALLPPEVAVVEYYSLPDRLLVFWLAADGVEVQAVPVAADALEATVTQLLIEIRAKGNGYLPHAARLGQWLLNPVARHLGRTEPLALVVVVPHGPLHPVPFEALPWAGRLLIDRFAVVTQPNLTAVAAALQAPAARPFEAVVAVGDPRENLPGAREEAVELAARFPGGRALVGGEASESKVREILKETGESGLLHFAVHGIRPGPTEPLYLELMPDSAFDGRLHADELATLQVPAGLVVLSVCDSAGGRGETGDEIPWVVDRAFLEAGARTVLASRWPVHDAASVLFMRNFYAALAQPTAAGLGGPIEAFRRAQLALRNGRAKPEELGPLLAVLDKARGVQDPPAPAARLKDFTHPYFWATFSLRGAWR